MDIIGYLGMQFPSFSYVQFSSSVTYHHVFAIINTTLIDSNIVQITLNNFR